MTAALAPVPEVMGATNPEMPLWQMILTLQLWTFCYDVAFKFREDRSIEGAEFFKRAKTIGIALEAFCPGVEDGLESALRWKQDKPTDAAQRPAKYLCELHNVYFDNFCGACYDEASADAQKILADLLKDLDAETGTIRVGDDAGCPICTVGTVPNNQNKGLCAFHRASAALAKASAPVPGGA